MGFGLLVFGVTVIGFEAAWKRLLAFQYADYRVRGG